MPSKCDLSRRNGLTSRVLPLVGGPIRRIPRHRRPSAAPILLHGLCAAYTAVGAPPCFHSALVRRLGEQTLELRHASARGIGTLLTVHNTPAVCQSPRQPAAHNVAPGASGSRATRPVRSTRT